MITILEQGSAELKTFKVTCTSCNCKFLYQSNDLIRRRTSPDLVKDSVIFCPECRTCIPHFNENELAHPHTDVIEHLCLTCEHLNHDDMFCGVMSRNCNVWIVGACAGYEEH